MFEDEDPQKPYYLPFGPSKKGQVIPMSNMAASESTNRIELNYFWGSEPRD
jgi:hypothetical protein